MERNATSEPRGERRWPQLLGASARGIAYGGDYNPDQWPEEIWDEDVKLMKQAGVNVVSLGIFSWDRVQPSEGEWDFAWLDRIIGKLGAAGISVDLATMTAAAPLWLYETYPEVLPVEADGTVVNAGSRQSWRPTSPVFRKFALELVRRLAERYGDNPAVTAWHVDNELGWNNRHDYSDDAQREFRRWCARKYGSVEALNEAWGTAFWSQHVNSFDEVLLPRHMGADSMANPAQQLDFERFGSDCLLDFYHAERDVIRQICPDKPCTTNFMVSTDQCCNDYAKWARDVDFVSNDHYFKDGPEHLAELACSDSLVSAFAAHEPWYLMEHSTSAVQWKPFNARKRHGELVRDALAHVAFGADAICFFQWRASRSGAECFHSAMVPHAGADSKVFREVCELGGLLETLGEAGVPGSRMAASPSRTAILFSADCEWMTRCETLPSSQLNHFHAVRDWYYAFLNAGLRADVVPAADFVGADRSWQAAGYDTVVLPTMVNVSSELAAAAERFAAAGGTVVIDYATGLTDDDYKVALGGYPGMLRGVAGVRSEEFNLLAGDEEAGGAADDCWVSEDDPGFVRLDNGATARRWANVVTSVDGSATVLARYLGAEAEDWELDGVPAIVRNAVGDGEAFYIGCDLDVADMTAFVVAHLGAGSGARELPGVIHTVREAAAVDGKAGRRFHFYLPTSKFGAELAPGCVAGEPVVQYRCDGASGDGSWRLDRNGVLVTVERAAS